VGISQEDLRTIKMKKLPTMLMKLDLSKAFDEVNWDVFKDNINPNRNEHPNCKMDLRMPTFIFICNVDKWIILEVFLCFERDKARWSNAHHSYSYWWKKD